MRTFGALRLCEAVLAGALLSSVWSGCGGGGEMPDAAASMDAATVDGGSVRDAAPARDARGPDDAGPPPDSGVFDNGETRVTIGEVGGPPWRVADVQLFSVAVGENVRDIAALRSALRVIFPDHGIAGGGAILPGPPHDGPYETELSRGLDGVSIDPGSRFTVADWTVPYGLVAIVALVPRGSEPLGSSPDFEVGPILPASLYPLELQGDLLLDGVVVDGAFDGFFPAPSGTLDGASHELIWMAESTAFIEGAPGEYTLAVQLRDATGSGWDLDLVFTIE